jgi:signal transduction histidine kinase
MEKGGELVIRADYRDSDQITIQVADTGKGIPEEILPRIFEPFFLVQGIEKEHRHGLSVVYGIVQTHHGTINVESTVNVGTTFTIVVPRAQPAAGEKQQQETAAPSA